jgi:hypothetical protein
MELRLFNFEIKNLYTEYWQLVSEVTALGMLEKNFERITPKITEMLHGKEIKIPEGIYQNKKIRERKSPNNLNPGNFVTFSPFSFRFRVIILRVNLSYALY